MSSSDALPAEQVRKVAMLARLSLTDAQVEQYRHQLGDVLRYMQRLSSLDLAGVEPMAGPLEITNRLAEDEPGPTLSNEQLMAIAPAHAAEPPFVEVPKVIGGGGEGS
jgi:aspartyl-tRNA(Asn)/glutamyl-tRNA(Gln) amidotransferase subunit C